MSFQTHILCFAIAITLLLVVIFSLILLLGETQYIQSKRKALGINSSVLPSEDSEMLLDLSLLPSSKYDSRYFSTVNINITVGTVYYHDPQFLGKCSYSKNARADIFTILKWWTLTAAKNNITWWIIYGTLLGAIRHNDLIPWDTDADIAIHQEGEQFLRNMATPRHLFNKSTLQIVCRPDNYCKGSWFPSNKRLDCDGMRRMYHYDKCSFCGPLCRIILPNAYVDIFLHILKLSQGIPFIYDENLEDKVEAFSLVKDVFPVKVCHFIGLKLPCPANSLQHLIAIYKFTSSIKICGDNHYFVDFSTDHNITTWYLCKIIAFLALLSTGGMLCRKRLLSYYSVIIKNM